MSGLSPTQRTLKSLREKGLKSAIVEKFNRFVGKCGIRQDLFGIIDIISLDPNTGVIGVQSTGQDFSGHKKKLLEDRSKECRDWLSVPGTSLELWGWRKVKLKRGGKAIRWKPRVAHITLENDNLVFTEIK